MVHRGRGRLPALSRAACQGAARLRDCQALPCNDSRRDPKGYGPLDAEVRRVRQAVPRGRFGSGTRAAPTWPGTRAFPKAVSASSWRGAHVAWTISCVRGGGGRHRTMKVWCDTPSRFPFPPSRRPPHSPKLGIHGRTCPPYASFRRRSWNERPRRTVRPHPGFVVRGRPRTRPRPAAGYQGGAGPDHGQAGEQHRADDAW